jgi:tetratricopeptide (TPR) repeat protein
MSERTETAADPVEELLVQWEERRRAGEKADAHDLCRDRPELEAEVARRIRALESVYRVFNQVTTSKGDSAETAAPSDEAPQAPGYEILGVLGRGGMGVVHKARNQRLNRLCALKMLRYEGLATPVERLRFRIEAEAIATLQHPNIVQLFEIGEMGRAPFLVLEYVDGPTLAERIRDNPLATPEAVELVRILALAVDYAHRRGIVHRDLKPGNVLLTRDGTPKIGDFGLAKRLAGETGFSMADGGTASGAVFGTPAYMAPEQASGRTRDVGPATDVYSLGAILYELITGRTPFRGESVLELLEMVRSADPVPPRRLSPTTPRDLETVCLKCLEKDPAKRYPSAEALANDLRRVQNGEPIEARPVGRWERAVKWVKRRPAVAAVLALLVVMAVGGTALAVVATRAQKDAIAAAGQEKKAKETAQARQAEQSAVLSFVENRIFAAARPLGQMGGLGRDVPLRRAIEEAVPYVDKSFTDKPLIEARLRLTLGTSFWYLGDGIKSAEQNERARDLYTKHLGPDAPETLMSISNLTISYDMLGQYDKALALREVVLARRRATLGPQHRDTVASMNNLAISYENHGRHPDALKLRQEVLALDTANHGPDHPDTLRSMSNLANSLSELGREEEALDLREKVLARRKIVLGPEHPDTLLSMSNLANSYDRVNRPVDALQLKEKTFALQSATLGPEHDQTLITMNNIGYSFAELGRHDEALDMRKKVLALREARHGRDHPRTIYSMYLVACSYAELKRYTEALDLHRETLKLQELHLAPDHQDIFWSMKEVAYCLVELDRSAEALPIIDDCIARASKVPGRPGLIRQAIALRLRHFKKMNDVPGCLATIEMWHKLNHTDAQSLYLSACLHAVTAVLIEANSGSTGRAQEEADRAMDWLRKAVAAGYHDSAHMAEDEDLDALRHREDFKKLLAEMPAEKKT